MTHRIAPDVDAERDLLVTDLAGAGKLTETRWIDDFHKELRGRNGGGDPWQTDGRLAVATLPKSAAAGPHTSGHESQYEHRLLGSNNTDDW